MSESNTWIISDTHYGHVNIPKFEPMRTAWGETWDVMTETMIRAWAAVVQPGDTVYHLGDFAMGLPDNMPKYRARLPGKIILIRGNHDRRPALFLTDRDELHTSLEFDHPRLGHLVLRHDPHDFTLDEAKRADLLLHGHLHSGNHRRDTPETIRDKAVCLSVERLPTRPAPMLFDDVGQLLVKANTHGFLE